MLGVESNDKTVGGDETLIGFDWQIREGQSNPPSIWLNFVLTLRWLSMLCRPNACANECSRQHFLGDSLSLVGNEKMSIS